MTERAIHRAAQSLPSIRIRPIRSTDRPGLEAFYARLSVESRRTRFFAFSGGIAPAQAAWFCSPDHDHREGLVAVDTSCRPARIVGHLCLEPDGSDSAEVAVAVADELQGRGIGRALVTAAVDWADRTAIRRLTATMLAANPAIQRLLTSLGLPASTRAVGSGIVAISIDLPPATARVSSGLSAAA